MSNGLKYLVVTLNGMLLTFVAVMAFKEGVHVFDLVSFLMYALLFLTPAATLIYLLRSAGRRETGE